MAAASLGPPAPAAPLPAASSATVGGGRLNKAEKVLGAHQLPQEGARLLGLRIDKSLELRVQQVGGGAAVAVGLAVVVAAATAAAAAVAAAPAADNEGGDGGGDDDAPLLSCAELDAAGRALIGTLLSTRHSGAIEKAAAGLGMLADRLLGCGLPERAALPRAWCAALLR